eukprot:CAMPEP_0113597216 /NCGR_PEP_ID=MMETSP0015_2-20120614/40865_1 /TAXON_ID=2838 /ORGANISM="Odontella" /LENGTH=484 /DNA_ID=CAMNT_0000505011 /DNA_START=77 /DNA_END=1531 /DNA_ORIENTATION=+ /assembly_acc=CAM_ASM_000160
MTDYTSHAPFAKKACDFLSLSPDPYHAVANITAKLDAGGYKQLRKREPFGGNVEPGGKYYFTVNRTTIVAFAVGGKYKSGNGFKIIGGHTDSPNLKVKPRSKRSASGCIQLGVECYGGGLWHTWFDRDLGISGRVLVRSKGEAGKEKIVQRFVKIDRPVARVSTLCIHLQTAEERKSFAVNKEEHLSPILGTQTMLEEGAKAQLEGTTSEGGEDEWLKGHEPLLLETIASELGIKVKDIADFELNMFDTQPAVLGGIKNEFLYSARLDNLATCFVSIESLVAHTDSDLFAEDEDISLVALFDHEEVGSESAQGAGSPVIVDAIRRITTALSDHPHGLDPDQYSCAVRKSFILSVDMAHAVHPNYAAKHEKNHGPKLNAGFVIKTNQNQRYGTNAIGGFIMREITRKADLIPVQEFVVRNDCGCGTTIGPIISSSTGIRTVDAGMPQLSMHSCREVMGIADLTHCFEMFKSFFEYFREIDDALEG